MEAAKHRGWQNWLKIEVDQQKLTERFTADALIRIAQGLKSGIARTMNSSNSGTVKAMSPYAGL